MKAPSKARGTELSENQAAALDFLLSYIPQNHTSPSVDELAVELDVTIAGAAVILNSLARKGYIVKSRSGRSRSVRVLRDSNQNRVRLGWLQP